MIVVSSTSTVGRYGTDKVIPDRSTKPKILRNPEYPVDVSGLFLSDFRDLPCLISIKVVRIVSCVASDPAGVHASAVCAGQQDGEAAHKGTSAAGGHAWAREYPHQAKHPK